MGKAGGGGQGAGEKLISGSCSPLSKEGKGVKGVARCEMYIQPTASSSVHPFMLWVVGSIISALVAAWIAGVLTKYWQKRTEEHEKS